MFAAAVFILAPGGCDKLDPTYYTRPDSPGYTKQTFTNKCPVCGVSYLYSQSEWDSGDAFKCPLHRTDSPLKEEKSKQANVNQEMKNYQDQQRQEVQRMQDEIRRAQEQQRMGH